MRRAYPIKILVNGVKISRAVIDSHYEIKHRASVNDALILELVAQLNEGSFLPHETDEDGYEYFTYDTWVSGKHYRLVWLLPPNRGYLGVVNAYRRRYGRNG